ncbi:hypothetical protein D1AOALGA4SA_7313 [Olavius algarvensis Delta 1 endosymbiont]|nr:hypothetical protein D1AOALGA4SA_7313 [Olavius algarvensis Delta 1 endosymbiont]
MRQSIYLTLIIIPLVVFACAANKGGDGTTIDGRLVTPQNLRAIAGLEWNLTRMTKDRTAIALVNDSQTTFACDPDGRVTGKATLNRYSGHLTLQADGKIVWSKAFIMTHMAGPPELMRQETDFSQTLVKTSRMHLKDSILVLTSEDRSYRLEFERIKK